MRSRASTRSVLDATLAAVLLLFPPTAAWAVTIYVDAANAGDPSMDGSAAHPWDTIQAGVNDITNQTPTYGHTVLVAAGSYSNVVLAASHSGTASDVNTLLTTANARISSVPSTGNAININDGLNYFTVDGFHITGANRGVQMADPSGTQTGVTIRNCNIYANGYGLYFSTTANSKVEHCNIVFNTSVGLWANRENKLPLLNCVIAGHCTYGINEGILSSTVQISNSVFYANRTHYRDWIGPGYTGEVNWTNRTTAAQINAAPGCGGNMISNPGFSDLTLWNFNELMTNSPCLDAGLGASDIGAHQNPPLLSLDNAAYYVDAVTGSDTNDGSSDHPWATITNAAARAKAGDTVTVNAGVYTGGVTIVRGGSADKVVTYRADGDVTIIASNSVSGIELRRVMGAVVEGFNVDAANKPANTQCLYLNQCASNSFRNLTLHNGKTYGVYAKNSLLCEFSGCSIYSNVCGVYTYNAPDIYMRSCDLRNNAGYGYQGAHQQLSFVIMENCLVRNNATRGFYCGQFAGGRLVNCNIVSNASDGIGQQGAYSTWHLTNCIIAGNGGYGVREVFSTQMGKINLSYCDLYGNALGNLYDITNTTVIGQILNTAYEINYLAVPAGCNTNNIVADPLFENWGAGDFRLRPNSPCIEAGATTSLDTDYAGGPRPSGNTTDIGAYEFVWLPAGTVFVIR